MYDRNAGHGWHRHFYMELMRGYPDNSAGAAGGGPGSLEGSTWTGCEEGALERGRSEPGGWLSWSRLPSGQVVPTSELLTESERKKSAVYDEMLRDIRALDGLNVLANGPAGTRIGVALADSMETTGWSSDQIGTIKRLSPQVVHSICVRQALVDARAHRETLSGLLDNTRTCVFQLDRRGRVVEANDLAGEMLRQRRALTPRDGSCELRDRRTTPNFNS